MKKTLLASAIAVAGLAVGGTTFAAAAPVPMMSGVMNPWYVGVGVNYSAMQTDKITGTNNDYLKLNNIESIRNTRENTVNCRDVNSVVSATNVLFVACFEVIDVLQFKLNVWSHFITYP